MSGLLVLDCVFYVSHKNSKFKTTNIVLEYLNLEKKLEYKKIAPYISFSKKFFQLKMNLFR